MWSEDGRRSTRPLPRLVRGGTRVRDAGSGRSVRDTNQVCTLHTKSMKGIVFLRRVRFPQTFHGTITCTHTPHKDTFMRVCAMCPHLRTSRSSVDPYVHEHVNSRVHSWILACSHIDIPWSHMISHHTHGLTSIPPRDGSLGVDVLRFLRWKTEVDSGRPYSLEAREPPLPTHNPKYPLEK